MKLLHCLVLTAAAGLVVVADAAPARAWKPGCSSCSGGGGGGGAPAPTSLFGGSLLDRFHKPKLPVYQAAPWYNYWPYDAHFLTPAPVAGPFYGPPLTGNFPVNPYFPGPGFGFGPGIPGGPPPGVPVPSGMPMVPSPGR